LAADLDQVIDDINASGYGLTFGFHSRIDDRVQRIVSRINVGNLYINRNQIGAAVGSQPFGGHGLSGTGPKAGGPRYLRRFVAQHQLSDHGDMPPVLSVEQVASAFDAKPAHVKYEAEDLPGPTGESNRYVLAPKNRVLCMGQGAHARAAQARTMGCSAIAATVAPCDLIKIAELEAVVYAGSDGKALRQALSQREGLIVPLLMDEGFETWLLREQSICIDTTAAGGNVALLAS